MTMLLSAIPIFFLRVVDVSLYTVRLMMVMRGRKLLAWIFAFFQSFVYINALRLVLSDEGPELDLLDLFVELLDQLFILGAL